MSKIIRVNQPPNKEPTAWEFFLLMFAALGRLSKTQKTHVGAALLCIAIPVGLICMAVIESAVTEAQSLPKPVQSVVAPVALALEIPDPAPTIFPVEEDEGEIVIPKKAPKKRKNDAAPRSVREVVPKNAEEYIAKYWKLAKKGYKKYRIPVSITLAQGLIESNCGKSSMATGINNHFGMKCFGRNCKKWHCANFKDDTAKDMFKRFPTVAACYDAHGQLLSGSRYQGLKKYGKNYRKWAYGLKSCGYATDKRYAEKLIGIIERYELYQYD